MSWEEETLSEPKPIAKGNYSLESDMLLGWRPKNLQHSPISLNFDLEFPASVDFFSKAPNPTVYYGYLPPDSFSLHKRLCDFSKRSYPFDFDSPIVSMHQFLSKQLPAAYDREEGMLENLPSDCLTFDSAFENGNLDRVVMVSPNEYDLYIRSDSNTKAHLHWFYFAIEGSKVNRKVKCNVVNFSRESNLYDCGMRPKVYSLARVRSGRSKGWESSGENVKFTSSKLNSLLKTKKQYYQLSFTISILAGDKIWVANNTPYTFSRLAKVLDHIKNDQYNSETSHIEHTSLGKSLSLVDIPLVTVTDFEVPESQKLYIVAIGRVHPSETVGSWVMEGFLRFICSKHYLAKKLRTQFVFKVVPMTNPDGVIIGNSRTNLSGKDLNRAYSEPDPQLQPEVVLVKKLVEGIQNRVFMFIDMHGHFCRKGSFVYGPYYPIHHSMYVKTRLVPKILGERTEIFRYYSSRFKVEKAKATCARVVMEKVFGIANSYTLETSYFGYMDSKRQTKEFLIEDLLSLGEDLAKTMLEYHCSIEELKSSNKKGKKKKSLSLTTTKIQETSSLNETPKVFKPANIPSFQPKTQYKVNSPKPLFAKTPEESSVEVKYYEEQPVKRNLKQLIRDIRNEVCPEASSSSAESGTESESETKPPQPRSESKTSRRSPKPPSRFSQLSRITKPRQPNFHSRMKSETKEKTDIFKTVQERTKTSQRRRSLDSLKDEEEPLQEDPCQPEPKTTWSSAKRNYVTPMRLIEVTKKYYSDKKKQNQLPALKRNSPLKFRVKLEDFPRYPSFNIQSLPLRQPSRLNSGQKL